MEILLVSSWIIKRGDNSARWGFGGRQFGGGAAPGELEQGMRRFMQQHWGESADSLEEVADMFGQHPTPRATPVQAR